VSIGERGDRFTTRFTQQAMLVTISLCLTVGVDVSTKSMIRQMPPASLPQYHFCDLLRLTRWENAGTLMSLGDGLSGTARFWTFSILVGGAAVGLIGFTIIQPMRPAYVVALALIAGGALSNVIDRLSHDGHVLDFIHVMIAPLDLMIFNFADFTIGLGAIILTTSTLRALAHR
jgi:signal peptidase II